MIFLNWIRYIKLTLLLLSLVGSYSCNDDCKDPCAGELTEIEYNPQNYSIVIPERYDAPYIPSDNPMTQEGVGLGQKLFYDPILSLDSTLSCATCHILENAFSNNFELENNHQLNGRRNTLSLIDVAFSQSGYFWDGHAATLEDQILETLEDEFGLNNEWPLLLIKLREHESYPMEFRKAFGIECAEAITKEMVASAIAQFERTIVNGGNSRYDKLLKGEILPTASELNGLKMFFNHESIFVDNTVPDAECSHCHAAPTFFISGFLNNAISDVDSNLNYLDLGRAVVTMDSRDRGKFKVPSLRNIALTAPYMHDGSMESLEEVLDHYSSGGHPSLTSDPQIYPLGLTEVQKTEIISFLHMLTDTVMLKQLEFSNPFE